MKNGKLYNADFRNGVGAEIKAMTLAYRLELGHSPEEAEVNPVHLSPSVPAEIYDAGAAVRIKPAGNVLPNLARVGGE